MAKTFFPKMFIMVSAIIHPILNTKFLLVKKRGGQKRNPVIKVQMVYNGEITGGRSPSYPLGTNDFQRVMLAAEKLIVKTQDTENEII